MNFLNKLQKDMIIYQDLNIFFMLLNFIIIFQVFKVKIKSILEVEILEYFLKMKNKFKFKDFLKIELVILNNYFN